METSAARNALIAETRPTRTQTRLATLVVTALIGALALTAPFADRPLEGTTILLPAYATAVLANMTITAALLYAIHWVQPSRGLIVLASGYLFVALSVVPWALTFPGVFAPDGLLGAGLQSTATIAAARRIGFPLAILAYALPALRRGPSDGRGRILPAIGVTVVAVIALAWLSVADPVSLPRFMADSLQAAKAWDYVPTAGALIAVAALVLLARRQRTVLDLWLMVVLVTILIETVLLAWLGGGARFTLGWWAGRAYGLASASIVLLVLLTETTALYVRLSGAIAAERRTRESRLATMEALAASIAHEVNQPLAAIAANAQAGMRWLEHEPPNLDETRAALARIAENGERAGEVVRCTRALFERGRRDRAPLDLNELLHGLLRQLQPELAAGRVETKTVFAPALPRVVGNALQLQQAVGNLVHNAVDAMRSIEDRPRILSMATQAQGADVLALSVADNGPGMTLEDQARIFEPFFTTKERGMGMGLLICRSIFEAHGGQLRLGRSGTEGTVFEVTLPAVAWARAEH